MLTLPSALRIHDPGRVLLRSAVRAAIVMPAVFAVADKVIADPQLATFAAFGSFAILVFAEFGGRARSRFIAYAALTCVGAANIAIGTLVSRSAWLAAIAMAAIGFVILFSGIAGGAFTTASTGALLTFILAAMVRAPNAALPARLEGWLLAAGAGVAAQLLIWPPPVQTTGCADAAHATGALAELAETELEHDAGAIADRVHAAGQAFARLRARFLALPHKPSGGVGPRAALGQLVDELDWAFALLAPPGRPPALDVAPPENAAAVAAVVDALRATAAKLDGRDLQPDLDELRRTRSAVAHALARRILEVAPGSDDASITAELDSAFRIRALSGVTEQIGEYALAAAGEPAPIGEPRVRGTWLATMRATIDHTDARDIWFRNSLRGAVGLAIAVYVAQRSGVQHSFWVVLGTLSVLRSNALGTGWSILSALAGTAVGIVLGSALVIGIGSDQDVLWAVLPLAILVGSYAPRAISFAAGQAGFTVVLFVLFNLIQPVGWRVELVRIEDVAIGFAISLGVGLLFWPRGASSLLRENLAASYSRAADYVVAAERELVAGGGSEGTAAAAAAAAAAAHRLDDAYRQAVSERATRRELAASVAPLVAGATRLRRAAESLSALAAMSGGRDGLGACGANLDTEVNAVRAWYVTLGDALARGTTVPPPHGQDGEGRRRLVECVRDALRSGDKAKLRPALDLVWASQHLDALWQLEEHLSRQAAAASSAHE